MLKGSCLCGAAAFTAGPAAGTVIACHCAECRRQSGHYFAAVPVRKDSLVFHADATLARYRASDFATRGFCSACGSTLFWQADEGPYVNIAMGALESYGDLRLGAHVWTREKGDYYDIAGDLPQFEEE